MRLTNILRPVENLYIRIIAYTALEGIEEWRDAQPDEVQADRDEGDAERDAPHRPTELAWIIHERSLCQSDGLKWTVAARCGVDE